MLGTTDVGLGEQARGQAARGTLGPVWLRRSALGRILGLSVCAPGPATGAGRLREAQWYPGRCRSPQEWGLFS